MLLAVNCTILCNYMLQLGILCSVTISTVPEITSSLPGLHFAPVTCIICAAECMTVHGYPGFSVLM